MSKLTRREFLRISALAGAGVALAATGAIKATEVEAEVEEITLITHESPCENGGDCEHCEYTGTGFCPCETCETKDQCQTLCR